MLCTFIAYRATPSMFCSTIYPETDFDGSVMITASHLPKERNGLKFFDKTGGFDKPDIKAILKSAGEIEPTDSAAEVEKFAYSEARLTSNARERP